MKVIFLDKDGVLNSDEYFDNMKWLYTDGVESDVDIGKVKLLKKAVDETGAKVVITASARYTRSGRLLTQLLRDLQIPVDLTPFINNIRGKEIKQWLADNPGTEDFVILDDEIFQSYDEALMKKLIKISTGNGKGFGDGLQRSDVDQIVQRLGRIKQKDDDDLVL